MVTKVISGGQVGADQGGLAAAKDLGLETGGWAPAGYRTLYGNRPELKLLGVKEHISSQYPPRTYTNARDSDATIRLAYDFGSAGEICTMRAIEQYSKPHIDVNLGDLRLCFEVADWMLENNVQILNVAGNAGKNKQDSTKIFKLVRNYMVSVLKACTLPNSENS